MPGPSHAAQPEVRVSTTDGSLALQSNAASWQARPHRLPVERGRKHSCFHAAATGRLRTLLQPRPAHTCAAVSRLPYETASSKHGHKRQCASLSWHVDRHGLSSPMAASLVSSFKNGGKLRSDEMISALKASPSLAAEVDAETGNTPLHFACCNRAPLAVVKALIAANRKAARVADVAGNLPIVGAVANGADADVIKALLEAHPDGVKTRQGEHTLLHSAASNGQTAEVVEVLLAAWAGAAAERDKEGNAPLHFAAACQAPPAVVLALLKACPEAAQWRGQMQRYPLSLCLLAEAPPASVQAIRDAFPGAQRTFEIVADYQNHGLGMKS